MKKLIQWSLLGLSFILLLSACDPNEGGVTDSIDFRKSKVEFDAGSSSINTTVWFYDNYGSREFFYYIDTDQNEKPEFLVRCNANVFTVSKESAPGFYNILKHTGKPTVSGDTYNLLFPASALELPEGFVMGYYFFEITERDRMPNKGFEYLSVVL